MPDSGFSGVVDYLVVRFGLDPSDVDKGLNQLENKLQGGLKRIMNTFVMPLAGALAANKMFGDYTRNADAIGKLANRLNLDSDALQAWSGAAADAGGSTEAFNSAIETLNRGIQEYHRTGSGRAKPALDALGISKKDVTEASGGVKDVFSILSDLAAKAESMDKAKFSSFAARLGLDQGTIQLLQEGRKGVDELVAKQKELGGYTKRDIEIAGKYNKAISGLGDSFKMASAIIMRLIVPAITWFTGKVKDGVNFMRDHETFAIAFFTGIAIAITGSLIPALGKLAAATLANPAFWVWAAIAAAVLLVALVIDDLITYINGGESALEGLWKKFGAATEIAEKLGKAWEWFKKDFSEGIDIIKNVISVIAELVLNTLSYFEGMIDPFVQLFKGAIALITGLWTGEWEQVGEALYNILSGTINLIIELIKGVFTALWDDIKWVWGKIKGLFGKKGDGAQGESQPAEESWLGKIAKGFSNANKAAIEAAKIADKSAEVAIQPSAVTNNNKVQNSNETNIGTINVTTQATDAQGVAAGLSGAIKDEFGPRDDMVQAYNVGGETK